MQSNDHPVEPPRDGGRASAADDAPALGPAPTRGRAFWLLEGRILLRWLAVLAAVLVPAVAWGVATASADASLGPHAARYEVTLDNEVTVDLGPLGTLVIESPLPAMLGVRVVVQEIPREVTAVGEPSTLAALGADLEGYVQFFTGPQATLQVVTRALVVDAARRALLAVLVIGAAIWVVRQGLGPTRRAELSAEVRTHRGVAIGVVVVVLVVAVTVTSSTPIRPDRSAEKAASAVFDGTPLEGARITGRLAGVIDTYGGYVVDVYRENEDFYASALDRFEVAWADRQASDEALQAARDGAAARARPDPSPTGGHAATASSDDPDPGSDPVVLLVISDLHCNVGMARIVAAAAERSGASVVLNAGDTTINGTAVESYCVSAFTDAVPDGAVMVVADGNHDSEQTSAQERAGGARVLEGSVIEVDGIRILGDSDPNATRIGVGTTLVGKETVSDQAHRLAEVACSDEAGVDLLLVHNPNVGNIALDQGCVPTQISGHMHRRAGPAGYGAGVRYVHGSTAGASLNQATVGPLNGVAELTLLRFDPDSRSFIDYRLIRVHPEGRVTVGFAVRWPDGEPAGRPSRGPR